MAKPAKDAQKVIDIVTSITKEKVKEDDKEEKKYDEKLVKAMGVDLHRLFKNRDFRKTDNRLDFSVSLIEYILDNFEPKKK